jgi:hypothetical protein
VSRLHCERDAFSGRSKAEEQMLPPTVGDAFLAAQIFKKNVDPSLG